MNDQSEDLSPNWDKWRAMPTLRVWEAIALSINLDPRHARGYRLAAQSSPGERAFTAMLRGEVWIQAMDDRHEVVLRASKLEHEAGGLAVRYDKAAPPVTDPLSVAEVITKEFVEFCIRMRMTIPQEMIAIVRPESGPKLPVRSELRATDWAEWRATPLVALWEASALSLNIRPQKFRFSESDFESRSQSTRKWMQLHDDDLDWDALVDIQDDFDSRAEMLVRAARADELGQHFDRDGCSSNRLWSCFSFVKTGEVLAYLQRCGIDVPTGWLPVANEQRGKWPWGDYETELLHALADAVKQWWSTYDPVETTPPSNAEVAEYLKKKGIAQSVAESIATIIRSDRAPAGRPKKNRSE